MTATHIRSCRLGSPLLGGVLAALVAACGSEGNGGPGPDPGLSVYGACGLEPNYIADTFFEGRFVRFPINVHIDLSGAAADLRDEYRAALEQGFASWAAASGGTIGNVAFVAEPGFAHVKAVFLPVIPGRTFALAASRITDVQTGPPDLIFETEIEFSSDNLGSRYEQDLRDGVITAQVFQQIIAGLAAHELGHSFGIRTHPGQGDEWLMSTTGFLTHPGPTTADLNTLRDNYCRP